jgi:hypothetical protein
MEYACAARDCVRAYTDLDTYATPSNGYSYRDAWRYTNTLTDTAFNADP